MQKSSDSLVLRRNSTTAGDLKANYQFGKTSDSKVSGEICSVSYMNDLDISVPCTPTYFSPTGNGFARYHVLSKGMIFRTHITYRSFSVYWIILALGMILGPVEQFPDSEDLQRPASD